MDRVIPGSNEREIAQTVFKILDEVIKDKKSLGLHEKWTQNYKKFIGKHWESKSKVPLDEANLIYRHVQQTCNLLTDNNPTFNISRMGDADNSNDKIFDDMQRAAEHWWQDQEQQDVLESSIKNGEIYGVAIEKVIFNPDLEYGMGEVETVIVDPFHFGVFPTKYRDPRDIHKADILLHYYPMSVREAKRRWPDKKNVIKPDREIINEIEDDRRQINRLVDDNRSKGAIVSLAGVAKEILNWEAGKEGDDDELVIVEAWALDYTMEKVVEETVTEAVGEEITATEIVETEKPKYPGYIRYIVCCNGKYVLEDRPNPNINLDVLTEEEAQNTYLYDHRPFSMVNSVKNTSSMWGLSDIEQLESLNHEINKSLSQLTLEKDRAVRKKWINPLDSGVPNEHFTNVAGILNPSSTESGQGIRVLDYPAIPQDIVNALGIYKDLFFLISATFELDQAQISNNRLAYKSIAALIERVATMMRGKIRNYGRLIRERGRMYLSHVQNFYVEDRWISYEDEQGIQTASQIHGQELVVPAKLTVVTGSTLPTSKVQQREEAVELFKLGAIDQQELLSSIEWPGRADVIQRMQAGPMGQAIQNLQMLGMPPELGQYIAQVGATDPKKLKQAAESGEIPPFEQVLMALVGGEQQEDPMQALQYKGAEIEIAEKEAAIQKTHADIQEIMARKAKIEAEIQGEYVDQEVRKAGMKLDEEKIRMDKARTVAEIKRSAQEAIERPKVTQGKGDSWTKKKAPPTKPAAKTKPAGYNEAGMESNNADV